MLKKLKHHRLYSFPVRPGTPLVYELVSVSDLREVTLLDGIQPFNELLKEESIVAHGPDQARELAETFLLTEHYSAHRTMEWELGLNVISRLSDIPFRDGQQGVDELRKIESEFSVHPPLIERDEEGYRYVFFAWLPVGGALTKREVLLASDHIVDYRVNVLAQWVGNYEAAH